MRRFAGARDGTSFAPTQDVGLDSDTQSRTSRTTYLEGEPCSL